MTAVVLLHCSNSDFLAYASVQLAAIGLRAVPVLDPERLAAAWAAENPSLVMLHWDTLGDAAYDIIARLRAARLPGDGRVALVAERLSGGFNIMKAFASGADELIEGAANPRIFAARIEAMLGRRKPSGLATMAGR